MRVCVLYRFSHVQLFVTLDGSPPGSGSGYEILQARILEWLVIPTLQGIFSTQGSNLGLLHSRLVPYHLSYQGS